MSEAPNDDGPPCRRCTKPTKLLTVLPRLGEQRLTTFSDAAAAVTLIGSLKNAPASLPSLEPLFPFERKVSDQRGEKLINRIRLR